MTTKTRNATPPGSAPMSDLDAENIKSALAQIGGIIGEDWSKLTVAEASAAFVDWVGEKAAEHGCAPNITAVLDAIRDEARADAVRARGATVRALYRRERLTTGVRVHAPRG